MKIIALICCRSGSKGIKNKNLKKFSGKTNFKLDFKGNKENKKYLIV